MAMDGIAGPPPLAAPPQDSPQTVQNTISSRVRKYFPETWLWNCDSSWLVKKICSLSYRLVKDSFDKLFHWQSESMNHSSGFDHCLFKYYCFARVINKKVSDEQALYHILTSPTY